MNSSSKKIVLWLFTCALWVIAWQYDSFEGLRSQVIWTDNGITFISQFGKVGKVSQSAEFQFPRDVALDTDGNIYVADTGNNRIQKFDAQGKFLMKFEEKKSGDGQLNAPSILVFDKNILYVIDNNRNRVQKFDTEGNFISKFWTQGSGDGQVNSISDISFDSDGNIYIADTGNKRVQKLNRNGKFVMKFGTSGTGDGQFIGLTALTIDNNGNIYTTDGFTSRVQKFDRDGRFLQNFGAYGINNGQFKNPTDIIVDGNGNILVADTGNNRVQKFDSNGKFLSTFGTRGANNGQFNVWTTTTQSVFINGVLNSVHAMGISLDTTDNIYVADSNNHRVQKFDAKGKFVIKFGIKGIGSPIQAEGDLFKPGDAAFDADGNIYIADTGNSRIQKFTKEGKFLMKFGTPGRENGQLIDPFSVSIDRAGNIYTTDLNNNRIQKFNKDGLFLLKFGEKGTGDGQFAYPTDVAFDTAGNIYVADTENHRIQKFDANGKFVMKFGTIGTEVWQMNRPSNVIIDAGGNIYVADRVNNRIQKFDAQGKFLMKFGARGTLDGEFQSPNALLVDESGNIYVADSGNNRIQKFSAGGNFITKFGTFGNGEGQFNYPSSILQDTDGSISVVDAANHRIQKFRDNWLAPTWPLPHPVSAPTDLPAGITFVTEWTIDELSDLHPASIPAVGSAFSVPIGLGIDASSNVYVTFTGTSNFLKKFTSDGQLTSRINFEKGSGNGQFNFAPAGTTGTVIDRDGNIYLSDGGNQRVQKLNGSGGFITKWGTSGSGDGQFSGLAGAFSTLSISLRGIALDKSGNIYVADTENHRIQKFSRDGTFIIKWGTKGSENGQFNFPSGIATDTAGNVYVTDKWNGRVQKFSSNGTFITKWGSIWTSPGQFATPVAIAVSSGGHVYVTEEGKHRIQIFTTSGALITSILLREATTGNPITDIVTDSVGNFYIIDHENNKIRKYHFTSTLSPSDPNCTSSFLQTKKTDYDKAITDLVIINDYIALNTCESSTGKTEIEKAACQRKIELREEKKTFIEKYDACKEVLG